MFLHVFQRHEKINRQMKDTCPLKRVVGVDFFGVGWMFSVSSIGLGSVPAKNLPLE
jgi:hypothetical protein